METVHGVDVSWMSQLSSKGSSSPGGQYDGYKSPKATAKLPKLSPPRTAASPVQPRSIPGSTPSSWSSPRTAASDAGLSSSVSSVPESSSPSSTPETSKKQTRGRSSSLDKQSSPGGSFQRRTSWLSSISSKFSSSPSASPNSSPQQPQAGFSQTQSPISNDSNELVPSSTSPRSAVLQQGQKSDGNAPYTPAPPKPSQAGFLGGVLRRFGSSSGAGALHQGKANGLVERRVLNVDHKRERCPFPELPEAKLRRVAFCVDVEIAPMPRYTDSDSDSKTVNQARGNSVGKSEGAALKSQVALKETEERLAQAMPIPHAEGEDMSSPLPLSAGTPPDSGDGLSTSPDKERENRKREKKKRSEDERKARKEKKRKMAEDSGSIPVEIHCDTSDSGSETAQATTIAKPSYRPTTNPVRIYRRCCQLRESPILKKITEQLMDGNNTSGKNGVVNRIDLTGYWLQGTDLVTLGDYLAVVPVRELVMENCGLNDEGLRVLLAGLLAAKSADLRRRKNSASQDQGGVIERLVLKNNKIGPDGWKHLALFLYRCRSIKNLDVSNIPLPHEPACANQNGRSTNGAQIPKGVCHLLSRAIATRLGGSTLELVNLGSTGPSTAQLGVILDGLRDCGVRRLSLANNGIDEQGVEHVTRYLMAGTCEGLDLGGNDLKDYMKEIAAAVQMNPSLWALSLAGCGLTASALCKIIPALTQLDNFRFIDLSQNKELFTSSPSAVGLLRRYLPKMSSLKRIHLEDVDMTAEQAIAIVEVMPEITSLAHINLLGNKRLMELADAHTEEAQEEACALYASLMAATRVSKSIICIDLEVPGEKAGEIVKAMAKQVVAYCLRNIEYVPGDSSANGATVRDGAAHGQAYPGMLVDLVGQKALDPEEPGDDDSSAPDEDYVIGGTGVVRALTCCLENRGDEFRGETGEFAMDIENGRQSPLPTGGKAKDMSKHLLVGARNIRVRLQPALQRARANPGDEMNLRKLTFLDNTLEGIIKRFEDEFPDTRELHAEQDSMPQLSQSAQMPTLTLTTSATEEPALGASDGEDESEIHPPRPLSRNNSVLSKVLDEEEGRVLRAGQRVLNGYMQRGAVDLASHLLEGDELDADHERKLTELAEDIGGLYLEKAKEKGPLRAFKEDQDVLLQCLKERDPEHWDRFVEAQEKAKANMSVPLERDGATQ